MAKKKPEDQPQRDIKVTVQDVMDEGYEKNAGGYGTLAFDYELLRRDGEGELNEEDPSPMHMLSCLERIVSVVIKENFEDAEDRIGAAVFFCKRLMESVGGEDRVFTGTTEELFGDSASIEGIVRSAAKQMVTGSAGELLDGLTDEQKRKIMLYKKKVKT